MLLQAGADTDLQNKAGRTALMEAARSGHTEIAQLLLQTGAETALKVSDGCYRYTALVEAAFFGHTEIVRLLLKAGAESDLKDQFGRTALLQAASKGRRQIVQLLLQAGANKDE
ncbi:unnamed protein product, partial [Symbiodinium pilosum]